MPPGDDHGDPDAGRGVVAVGWIDEDASNGFLKIFFLTAGFNCSMRGD